MWGALTGRQTTIKSAAAVLIAMVFVSRVLGLVRDRLLSARFVPDELGVYFAAFRIPNLLFELLVMGALTSAFIPVFTKFLSNNKEEHAHAMAATIMNLTTLILFVLAVPIFFWTEGVSRILAPGFSLAQVREMASFTRFMVVLQVVPLLIGNFFTGILQSYNYFFVPALAPVVYNVGIISGILLLSTSFGLWAPVVGVGIGAILFVLIQIPLLLRAGYRHSFRFNPKTPGVRDVARLMGPRTIGLAVSQIDTTIDLMLASLLGARMVTIFNFAQHLQQLPVGLFGTTIAQAVLPSLSVSSAKEEIESFKKTLERAVHQVFFFVLPASVLFMVLRIPIVRLVFGASRFDWEATVLTGMTLSAFSISLFAQATSQILARAFYALFDSRTPVVVGVITVLVNAILSIALIQIYQLPIWSLGISTSVASILNAGILLYLLSARIGSFLKESLFVPPLKMAVAAILMGIALYVPLKLLDQLVFDTTRTFGLLLLTGVSGIIGLFTYAMVSWVLGVGEIQFFLRLLAQVRRSKEVIIESAHE